MATEATLLDRIRALENRINYLERGQAVGITGTDQTIKGSHDRLDAFMGPGSSSAAMTRNYFVPATRGYVGNVSAPLHASDERGLLLDDAIDTYVIGNWYVPADYSSTMVAVTVVESSGTTGLLYVKTLVYHGAAGEAYNAGNNATGYSQVAPTTTQGEILSVSVSGVAAADYLTFVLHRDGNGANDTATAMACYCKGWLVTYTATR